MLKDKQGFESLVGSLSFLQHHN